ncbi:MAG: hypothetical protein GXP26_15625 [Planctomycetes bacterium]|nr:hypothetical protein [Planctomycetota bacterium]
MNEHRSQFQSLVDRARQEPAPPVDVAERVGERIRWSAVPRASDWPTWSAAGLSAAAAMVMMTIVMQEGISLTDPFGDWLSSLVMVMS